MESDGNAISRVKIVTRRCDKKLTRWRASRFEDDVSIGEAFLHKKRVGGFISSKFNNYVKSQTQYSGDNGIF